MKSIYNSIWFISENVAFTKFLRRNCDSKIILILVNDRNALNWDSAETEASARSTEASAEASAESLAKISLELRENLVIYPQRFHA